MKEFTTKLNRLKRQPAILVGHMLPCFVNDLEDYLQRSSIYFT